MSHGRVIRAVAIAHVLALSLAGCAIFDAPDLIPYPGASSFGTYIITPLEYVDELPAGCGRGADGCSVFRENRIMSVLVCTPYVRRSVRAAQDPDGRRQLEYHERVEHCERRQIHPGDVLTF